MPHDRHAQRPLARPLYTLAAAGLALPAAALAQPASTDLGTLASGANLVNNVPIAVGEVVWYRFTLADPITDAGARYLDIDTEGSAIHDSNDTTIALFDSTGALVATDDDDGTGLLSQLTFGATATPRDPIGGSLLYDGRDGPLAPGVYYVAVAAFETTFGPNWGASSISTYSGTAVLRINHDVYVDGACCLPSGLCMVGRPADCAAHSGAYRGDGTTCDVPDCEQSPGAFLEGPADGGDLPATALVTTGPGPALVNIYGAMGVNDADLYRIHICDYQNFSASTHVAGTALDTQLFLFKADGRGVSANDDVSQTPTVRQSRLDSSFLTANGTYYLAVTTYNKDPEDAGGQAIWSNDFFTIHAPDGPGAANPIAQWNNSGTTGDYRVALTGACFAEPTGFVCYANCDESTNIPFLNVADFTCFLQRFAALDPWTNCDSSTSEPVLNVADFTCFLQKFAANCSAP